MDFSPWRVLWVSKIFADEQKLIRDDLTSCGLFSVESFAGQEFFANEYRFDALTTCLNVDFSSWRVCRSGFFFADEQKLMR